MVIVQDEVRLHRGKEVDDWCNKWKNPSSPRPHGQDGIITDLMKPKFDSIPEFYFGLFIAE